MSVARCWVLGLVTLLSGLASARGDDGRFPDLVVVSDLHAGEGALRATGQRSWMEDFHAEREFGRMVDYLVRRQRRAGRRLDLVLAGDALEFLNVVHPPAGKRWPAGPSEVMGSNETTAVLKAERIIAAHPGLFSALRRVVDEGHRVVFVAGNHDQELGFGKVRRLIRDAVVGRGGSGVGSVQFRSWLDVRHRVLIEHGHRYDPLNGLTHIGQPFEPGGEVPKLRTTAGSALLYRLYHPLKHKIRGMRKHDYRPRMLLALARNVRTLVNGLRDSAREIIGLARQDPVVAGTLERVSDRRLRRTADALGATINANRARQGKPPLDRQEVRRRFGAFGDLGDPIYPPNLGKEAGIGRVARSLLSIAQLKQLNRSWSTYAAALANGRCFAVEELGFDVHVCGHSHKAMHRIRRAGQREVHVMDTGTWSQRTPANRDGANRMLTFVEVRQGPERLRAKLRRWDPALGRPLPVPPVGAADGE